MENKNMNEIKNLKEKEVEEVTGGADTSYGKKAEEIAERIVSKLSPRHK